MIKRRTFTTMVLAALAPRLRAEAPVAAGRKLDFLIADEFNAGVEDIRAVLRSAAESIWNHCPDTRWETPGFSISYNDKYPITEFAHREDGRIGIGLNVRGNYWAQFAYQFAHEFCHALAGHSNDWRKPWIADPKANHWLEESFCETASLYALRAMGRSWQASPPFPNWKSYAPSLTGYAADRLENTKATLAEDSGFIPWFRENEDAMRVNATLREKNNVVARMLLPVFEKEPSGWEAVTSLNLTKRVADISLSEHFTDWSAVSPEVRRPFIAKVAGVFGIRI